MTRTFYTRDQCEAHATDLLHRYQRLVGERLSLPVDVALIGEIVCELTWDWADIADQDGQIIWGRLLPSDRRVEMNERYAAKLHNNQGLDRFTRAHELGHWELHAEHPNRHQLALLPLEPIAAPVYCRGGTADWIETHADWFAAALLMPRDLFCAATRKLDLTIQANMEILKKTCDVSWQALSIRLDTFGIPYVDRDGVEHRS